MGRAATLKVQNFVHEHHAVGFQDRGGRCADLPGIVEDELLAELERYLVMDIPEELGFGRSGSSASSIIMLPSGLRCPMKVGVLSNGSCWTKFRRLTQNGPTGRGGDFWHTAH